MRASELCFAAGVEVAARVEAALKAASDEHGRTFSGRRRRAHTTKDWGELSNVPVARESHQLQRTPSSRAPQKYCGCGDRCETDRTTLAICAASFICNSRGASREIPE
jgi:hypothetical protein